MVRENSLERDKSYSRIIFFLGLIFRVFVIKMIFCGRENLGMVILLLLFMLRCSVYLSGVVIFRLAEVPGDRARPRRKILYLQLKTQK